MQAQELFDRTKAEFINRGIKVDCKNVIGNWFYIPGRSEVGARSGCAHVTYRSNGTEEDVTVTIEIYEIKSIYSGGCAKRSSLVGKIKIPKNASDKVLKNRIDKAEELLKVEQI